ncbi:MAG: Metallo-beta-lactamase [Candidatus Woesebacteria bacterium GW2011_GWC1_38_13]|uniref:Metallo-beta-lactamase n=2 Tax=Candidatus Woeseibacteriota TaxID=1752722 RepID=A0A0G0INK2_9BACT|nr:MAG: Metallo-beta-lactamase [Candidatus Woesebacteria bacterium GW2011_GWD1_38_10]KKQ56307.1 MAG: Metallo-beta-lactamase [Candidatus Woesebacteria bacterium GW2011_GWC1_38_13]
MSLKFIALSGTISVTENLYVYEADGKMVVVDCGVGFPDLEMPGVDLVIPDFSYIVKNKAKLAGIVVSQGHEDHIGALPYLLREVSAPIWSAPLVTEFLKEKFEDLGIKGVKINTFDPENSQFRVGPFVFTPFRVTHSVPDACGFAIDTPEGRVFHIPEHKMDQNPVVGKGTDIQKIKNLASGNILFLASDCLGANKPGYTGGERHLEDNLYNVAKNVREALLMTAISSNIGRFQQMVNVAVRLGRKVVFVGRSIQKKVEAAHRLGYIKYSRDQVISLEQSYDLPRNKVAYIVSGCYGQVGSSLYRIAEGKHERMEVLEGDMVIFSADPAPPYSKESEDYVIDKLIDMGVDVHYYDLNEGLYVSGHGGQEDIVELFNLTRPKYYIPIGGAVRFMHAYRKLVIRNGGEGKDVFILKPGDNVDFKGKSASLGQKISTKEILVHGLGIGDIGKVVLGDRTILGSEGFVVALIKVGKDRKLKGDPEIISRGFVFEKIEKALLRDAEKRLRFQIEKNGKVDKKAAQLEAKKYLEKFFFQKTGRRPMILPIFVEI